jgi:hypothetical protein
MYLRRSSEGGDGDERTLHLAFGARARGDSLRYACTQISKAHVWVSRVCIESRVRVVRVCLVGCSTYALGPLYAICYHPLDPGTSPPRSTAISVMQTTQWSWMTQSSGRV